MLTVIWIVPLLSLSIVCAYLSGSNHHIGRQPSLSTVAGEFLGSLFALLLYGPMTVVEIYRWLGSTLPQAGTFINHMTALILAGMAGLLLWLLPLVVGHTAAELHIRLRVRGAPAARER